MQVHVEALALADVRAAVGSHIENLLLADLPDGLVDLLDVIGDAVDALDGAVVGDDHVLHLIVPETLINEFAKEPRADDLEFTSEDTTSVNIAAGRIRQSRTTEK